MSEDKQQEARSSPALAEVAKQEQEVPRGLRRREGGGAGRGAGPRLLWAGQVQPLPGHASQPQFPRFKVAKKVTKHIPQNGFRG